MRPKSLIVLEALLMGIPVTLSGYECHLISNQLCIPMYDEHGNEQDKMFGLQMPLHGFLNYCDALPDDEIAIIAMNVGLNKEKRSASNR